MSADKKDTKKHLSEKDVEASEKISSKPIIYFGVFLLFVFIGIYLLPQFLDTLGIDNEAEKYYFNGFLFEKIGPLWYTQIQKNDDLFDVPMHYGPKELLDISYDNQTSENVKKFFFEYVTLFKEKDQNYLLSYLTFDPNDNLSVIALGAAELTFKLRQTSRIKLISACTDNSTGTGCEDRMRINCTNTDFPVIYLNQEKIAKPIIEVDDNCLTITGDGSDLLRAVDRVLYSFFRIMN